MDVYIKSDGLQLFERDNTQLIKKTMSTAWDLTTLSTGTTESMGLNNTNSLEFSSDGTKMYVLSNYNVLGSNVSKLLQYSLSTPWNISTVSTGTTAEYTLPLTSTSGTSYSNLLFNVSGSSFSVKRTVYTINPTTYENDFITFGLSTNWNIGSGVTQTSVERVDFINIEVINSIVKLSGGEVLIGSLDRIYQLPSITSKIVDSYLDTVFTVGFKVYNNESLLILMNSCADFEVFELNYITVYPSNVPSFTATQIGGGSTVELDWNVATIDSGSINKYEIEWKESGDVNWNKLPDVNHPTTTYSHTVIQGYTYNYRIKAVSTLGVKSQLYSQDTVIVI